MAVGQLGKVVMTGKISIGRHLIGLGEPVFIIAEAGVNHNGNLASALELVDVAVSAGADAVKFQTFISESAISPVAEKAAYQKVGTGANKSQLEMVKRLELPFEAFRKIRDRCN